MRRPTEETVARKWPPPGLEPRPEQLLGRPDVAHHVHLPDALPDLLRRVGPAPGLDTGVGAEQVDLAEVRASGGYQGCHILLLGGVTGDGGTADLLRHAGRGGRVQVVHDQAGARGGEPAGEGGTDAGAGSCDDDGCVLQLHGSVSPVLLAGASGPARVGRARRSPVRTVGGRPWGEWLSLTRPPP